jgi:hypothetical protein
MPTFKQSLRLVHCGKVSLNHTAVPRNGLKLYSSETYSIPCYEKKTSCYGDENVSQVARHTLVSTAKLIQTFIRTQSFLFERTIYVHGNTFY